MIRPPGASRVLISDPCIADRVLGILPQHVERPHQNRAVAGQFEAAEPNSTASFRRPGRVDALGVDLQTDHPDVEANRPQPTGQLERGDRQCAVAEVDDKGVGGRLQRGAHPR